MWITNATLADLALVWARGPDGVLGFLLERGTPGFTAQEIRGKYSLRASDTGELAFDAVRLPDSARLPAARGLKAPLACLNEARYGIAWGTVGAAADCYHTALTYALERRQFDRPVAAFQLVQARLVDMLTEITKAQGLAHQLGRLKDRGVNPVPLVSLAKRNNVAMALDCRRVPRRPASHESRIGEDLRRHPRDPHAGDRRRDHRDPGLPRLTGPAAATAKTTGKPRGSPVLQAKRPPAAVNRSASGTSLRPDAAGRPARPRGTAAAARSCRPRTAIPSCGRRGCPRPPATACT
jgi:hypothetical protein